MWRLQLQEALRSLRRNLWFSALLVTALAVGVAVFGTAHTSRVGQGEHVAQAAPGLYHVEIQRDDGACELQQDPGVRLMACSPNLLLSWDEAMALTHLDAGPESGVTFVADTLVARPGGEGSLESVRARFSSSRIFELFRYTMVAGRPFTAEDEVARAPVAVIDDDLAARWFPGQDPVGRWLELRGRRFQIVGVADYQATMMRSQDMPWPFEPNVHLPVWSFLELRARPVNRWADPRVEAGQEDRLLAGHRWVEAWVRLEDAGAVAAFRREAEAFRLREVAAGRLPADATVVLRSMESWTGLVAWVYPALQVFELIGVVSLIASAFGLMRLLMARLHARLPDVGVRRALGATRGCLFGQELLAGVLIGVLGGALGLVLAAGGLEMMNRYIVHKHVRFALDLHQATVILASAIGAAVFAAGYPAWRLGLLSPAEALKRR